MTTDDAIHQAWLEFASTVHIGQEYSRQDDARWKAGTFRPLHPWDRPTYGVAEYAFKTAWRRAEDRRDDTPPQTE